MNKAVIIILASLCVFPAGVLLYVVSKKGHKSYVERVPYRPRYKRIKYGSKPAISVSHNTDLVKERDGYALYYYWESDYDTVVIRGNRGGILYIGHEYFANYNGEHIFFIARRDYHGRSSKPIVGWITDCYGAMKVSPHTYKITNRKDNDMNTFDTTGIGFITPDEFLNNHKYVDWKSM